MFAKVLFQNLQVPSLSFAPSHVLALLAAGRITGLVIDCGHLETTVLPVFSSRPLFSLLCTTPLAGARLTAHIRALLLRHGTYIPPQSTLAGPATSVPEMQRAKRIPASILTDTLVEAIKTRACFVGGPILPEEEQDPDVTMMDIAPTPSSASASDAEIYNTPPMSEAHTPVTPLRTTASSAAGSVSGAGSVTGAAPGRREELEVDSMAKHSRATDLRIAVGAGAGRGVVIIPGWVRERAAEVLFTGGDVDERSVAETVLDCLRKVPVDLRKELISSILVVGGTSMLPGFVSRLYAEVKLLLSTPVPNPETPPMSDPPSPTTPTISTLPRPPAPPPLLAVRKRWVRQPYDPYARLRPLAPHLAVLNAPAGVGDGHANSGKAPAFAPAALPWVGGSLAGSLKIGGEEISREKYEEAAMAMEEETEAIPVPGIVSGRREGYFLPDWTKGVMMVGAPNAAIIPSGTDMDTTT